MNNYNYLIIGVLILFLLKKNVAKVTENARFDAPTVRVDAPTVRVDAPTVRVDVPTVKVDIDGVKVDIELDGKKFELDGRKFELDADGRKFEIDADGKRFEVDANLKRIDSPNVDAPKVDPPKVDSPKINPDAPKTNSVAKKITKNWKKILAAGAVGYLAYSEFLGKKYQKELEKYLEKFEKFIEDMERLENCVEKENPADLRACIGLKLGESDFPTEDEIADIKIVKKFFKEMAPYIKCLLEKPGADICSGIDRDNLKNPPIPPDQPKNPLHDIPLLGGLLETFDKTFNFGVELKNNILKYGPIVIYSIIAIIIIAVFMRIFSIIRGR